MSSEELVWASRQIVKLTVTVLSVHDDSYTG